MRERPPGEADRVGGGAQVARDERQVARLDRDVGARADREAEVGLGERRGVVDAVADHRDDLAGALQRLHLGALVAGEDVGEHALDADLGGDRAGGALVVAREQDGLEPEPAELGDRRGRRRP